MKGEIIMPKRGENIYRRKDNRWEGRIKIGRNEKGKLCYKYVYGKSYSDCKQKLTQVRLELGKDQKKEKVTMTVKTLCINWLSSVKMTVKNSTFDTYERITQRHIIPIIGDMPVYSVTAETLNQLTAKKFSEGRLDGKGGLLPKTVSNIICVIKLIFKYSHKIYHSDNAAEFISMPKIPKKHKEVLTAEETEKIKEYCSVNENYMSLAAELCLATGIRIGELCALQCIDINFKNCVLNIAKTVQRIKNTDVKLKSKTKVVISEPKTSSSSRSIPLPEKLAQRLKEYIDSHQRKDNDYIFSANGKTPIDVRTIQKKFAVILKNCGIRKVNFHILRHTFATKWANSNFNIKALSEILGHSNINITLSLYVHPSAETKRKLINKLYLSA